MKWIKDNWLVVLILIVAMFMIISGDADKRRLEKEIKQYQKEIKELNVKIKDNLELIDKLSEVDTVYKDSIRIIKEKAHEQIIYVDTMSVSDMQRFFSKRYSEE